MALPKRQNPGDIDFVSNGKDGTKVYYEDLSGCTSDTGLRQLHLAHQLLTLRTTNYQPTTGSYITIKACHQVRSRCRRVVQLSFHILLAFRFTHLSLLFWKEFVKLPLANVSPMHSFQSLSFSWLSTYRP